MKETLKQQKEQIKLETIKIRSLKQRNKILARNHSLTWKDSNELSTTRSINNQRHQLYFMLKNLYGKYNKDIMESINSLYPIHTAIFLNEKGAEADLIRRLNLLGGN
ncbi:MAG: hypothetical protein ACYDD5_00405 [Sulfuricurvum sp.]